MTPELAPPLLTTTPHQREDVSALDRFNVHRYPTWRVFSEEERERGDGKREEKESGEREEPALDGEKGLVRYWSGKTMNAGGVENRIWTDCTGLAYGLNSIA
ncbi:hypothetical protein TNCV_3645641 [Trichonephila clavipes]|nr:hypothetical protein TNCV_3645641 [Trichonephila clavipes]